MPATVVDDHLLRDILVGDRDETLDGLAPDGVATTGLGGRSLSAAMVEALAAAHRLGRAIAVSHNDVGPNLRAAAEADGVTFPHPCSCPR